MLLGLFYSLIIMILNGLMSALPSMESTPTAMQNAFTWLATSAGNWVYVEPELQHVIIALGIGLVFFGGASIYWGINWVYKRIPFKFT